MNDELDYKTVEMMEQHGGSFVKALAECFRRADFQNFSKLKKAFRNYWQEYQDIALKRFPEGVRVLRYILAGEFVCKEKLLEDNIGISPETFRSIIIDLNGKGFIQYQGDLLSKDRATAGGWVITAKGINYLRECMKEEV